ncbi:MAG TPA: murein biosynthesis integral membrane protein MurJ [Syntrophorhabdales bacterium]|nr:murein biosynthesis integral membrane protein MurJ [Syntrophorhabdales bacterium]
MFWGTLLKQSSADYLIRKGSVITGITLVSRPLGFVREAVQAYLFGATRLVGAFVIAFNFPELIQTLFFSGATSAFLIPVCSRYLEDREEFSRVYSLFMNVAIIITALASIFLLVASGPVMRLIAPGFSMEERYVTRCLFIIMIPVIPLHAMLSVMKAFLNAKEQFAAPELSGIIWNIIFILAALTISGTIGIYSLAVGVALGAVAQIILQIPYLRGLGIHYRMTLPLDHPSLKEAKRLFTGALIATSVVPINSFIGRSMASYLPEGGVASLAYAFRIFLFPYSLFAVSIYTVLFSKLSRLFHEEDWKGIDAHVDSSLVLVCITLVPSTIFLCVAGDVLVKLLYQRGAFTLKDTLMTYRALSGYSVGLIFYALSISFGRIFNARHDMKTPARVGITSIGLNVILVYLLMMPLGNLGVALATSIVSFYNFSVLYVLYRRKTGYRPSRKTKEEIVRSLIAGAIVTLLLLGLRKVMPGRPYSFFTLGIFITVAAYGLFFKSYYLAFLGKRQEKDDNKG